MFYRCKKTGEYYVWIRESYDVVSHKITTYLKPANKNLQEIKISCKRIYDPDMISDNIDWSDKMKYQEYLCNINIAPVNQKIKELFDVIPSFSYDDIYKEHSELLYLIRYMHEYLPIHIWADKYREEINKIIKKHTDYYNIYTYIIVALHGISGCNTSLDRINFFLSMIWNNDVITEQLIIDILKDIQSFYDTIKDKEKIGSESIMNKTYIEINADE